MNKYGSYKTRELLVMNAGLYFRDLQLEEEICRRAGLFKEWAEADNEGLGRVLDRAVKILLKVGGIKSLK